MTWKTLTKTRITFEVVTPSGGVRPEDAYILTNAEATYDNIQRAFEWADDQEEAESRA